MAPSHTAPDPRRTPAAASYDTHVAAVVLRDAGGLIATVRKRGTARFMLPGGKLEAGEDARDAAARECLEELGVVVEASSLEWLGDFVAPAANEPGQRVRGTVFTYPNIGHLEPRAEIEALRWLDPVAPLPPDLAPLLEHHVLPALERR